MKASETGSLVAMGALWGGSFAFQRVLVPQLGPVPATFARLAVAGLFLVAVAAVQRTETGLKAHWKLMFWLGLLTSAVPYSLFAFGAKFLPAALLAVLNATAPMFGAVFAALFLGERLTAQRAAGLALGSLGVVLVSEAWHMTAGSGAVWGVAACLLASACYGYSGVVVTLRAKDVPSFQLAVGGQLLGAAALLPFGVALWPREAVPLWVWPTSALFGVLCSATPYLLYMWLLARVGATRALTVTFLIPVFGALWGALLLRERLDWVQACGGVVIVLGTVLVVKPNRVLEPEAA